MWPVLLWLYADSLIPRPHPPKSKEGLVTLAPFPISTESAVLILSRPITSIHFQLLCQLLNSLRRGKPFIGEIDMVAIPRLALEVIVWEMNAVIKGVVRRLSYNVPTMKQNNAVTAFVRGRDVFVSLPMSNNKSLCYACLPNPPCYMLTRAYLTHRATCSHVPIYLPKECDHYG